MHASRIHQTSRTFLHAHDSLRASSTMLSQCANTAPGPVMGSLSKLRMGPCCRASANGLVVTRATIPTLTEMVTASLRALSRTQLGIHSDFVAIRSSGPNCGDQTCISVGASGNEG